MSETTTTFKFEFSGLDSNSQAIMARAMANYLEIIGHNHARKDISKDAIVSQSKISKMFKIPQARVHDMIIKYDIPVELTKKGIHGQKNIKVADFERAFKVEYGA